MSEQSQTSPGDLNERDIEMCLHRAFSYDQVYRNPIRADNGREFVDVLVVTNRTVLLIQAKDSPVAEAALSVFEETDVPCLLLDYVDFQELTYSLPTGESLVDTLEQMFAAAREHGLFARSRFGRLRMGRQCTRYRTLPPESGCRLRQRLPMLAR